jgi:hypothetical protein
VNRCLMLCLFCLPLGACDTGPAEPSRSTTDPYDTSTSLRISGTVVWPDCTPARAARVTLYVEDCTGFVWDACPRVARVGTQTRANGSYTIEATLDDCARLDLVLWAQTPVPDSAGLIHRSFNVEGTCEAVQAHDFVLGDLEQCVPEGLPAHPSPSLDWR